MSVQLEHAALVALLRRSPNAWRLHGELIEMSGSALAVLEQERGLLARSELDPVLSEIDAWERDGLSLVTVLDDGYPDNLRAAHDHPPLIFVLGELQPVDGQAIAVIGARAATRTGAELAADVARHLIANGYTVVSGLAAGIDTAAHTAALASHGRTVAVIGTGVRCAYPPQNAGLQQQIADRGAVVSRFWPDASPTRQSFPMRNAVMSGLALATVIIEASHTSGARIQARQALAHGRPVFLHAEVTRQRWAQELAARPGVHRFSVPDEITAMVTRLFASGPLSE